MKSESPSQENPSGDLIAELVHRVIQALLKRKQTVSFAESCTGGQLSAWITERPGVSVIYKGLVVSYSNEAKVEILGVGLTSLQSQGAVSQVVAQEMAQGVRHRFHTDWGISITGIAGPTGGSAEKPVGTVCLGISGPSLAKAAGEETTDTFLETRQYLFKGDRNQIQEQSVRTALELLLEALTKQN